MRIPAIDSFSTQSAVRKPMFGGRFEDSGKVWKILRRPWTDSYDTINIRGSHRRRRVARNIEDINGLRHPETGEPAPLWLLKKDWDAVIKLRSLYKHNYDIDASLRDPAGNTALAVLFEHGRGDYPDTTWLVSELKEAGADYAVTNHAGESLLFNIARSYRGDVWREQFHKEQILEVLKAGVDINQKNGKGQTALMIAAARGRDDLVGFMMMEGADPNLWDNDGNDIWYYVKQNTGNARTYEATKELLLGKTRQNRESSLMVKLSELPPSKRQRAIEQIQAEIELRQAERKLADTLADAELSDEEIEALARVIDETDAGQE